MTVLFKKARLKALTAAILGMFAGGVQGVVLDANDWGPTGTSGTGVVFQDGIGTPVTAMEQPVQLILDKSQGLVKTEQITNVADRAFTSNTGFWSLDAGGVTISGGSANWAALSAYAFSRSGFLAAGKTYLVTVTVLSIASGGLKIYAPTALGTLPTYTTPGTYTALVTAASASSFGVISVGTTTAQVSYVSCQQIAGNHAWVPASANRPIITARYNNITKSEDVSNSAWTKYGVTPTVASGITLPSKYAAASLITSNAGAGNHYSVQGGSTVYPAGTQITLTQWVQRGNQQYYFLGDQSDAVYHNATFDLIAGTVSGQTNAVGSIVPNGNGFDLKATFTLTNATSVSVQFGVSMIANVPSVGPYTAAGTETVYVTGIDVRPTNQATGLIPTYQRVNTATDYDWSPAFPPIIKGNGTNQYLTGNMDLSGTNKVTVWAGVRKTSGAAQGILFELGASVLANAHTLGIYAPNSAGSYAFLAYQSAASGLTSSTYTEPITNVISAVFNTSAVSAIAAQIFPRVNGATPGSNVVVGATGAGSGNFSNSPYYLLSRAGTSLFMSGGFNTLILAGKAANDSEIKIGEQYSNLKIKAA